MNFLNTFINRNGAAAKQNKLEQKVEQKKANKLASFFFLNKISKRPPPTPPISAASIETLTPAIRPASTELFKKRVTFSTEPSFNPKLITLNKLSNESISLYQMYNDNNTFTEFNMSDNPTESSFDSSDNGFESDFTSSKLSLDQAKPALLKSILSNRSSNSSVSGDSLLAHSFSTLKLDQQIRFKLAGLKLSAARLGLFQSNVCMLEAVYGLKIDAVRVEARAVLSKFDRKTGEHAEKKSLNKFISSTAKLFKSYRRRSKSVELNKEASAEKSFGKQPHSNYYACERDALEKKFEDQIRAIQVGILGAIGGVEQQLHEIILKKELSLNSGQQKRHCHRHKRCHRHGHDLNKSRVNYSTELPMQKRINRQKERSTNLNGYVLRDRSYDASRLSGSFNQSLNSSDLQAKKYRNPYATETSV